MFKKSVVEDDKTQAPAIQRILCTQSLRGILAFKKRYKIFLKIVEKDNGDVFWIGVLVKPFRENAVEIKNSM